MRKIGGIAKAAAIVAAMAISSPALASTTIYLSGGGGSGSDGNARTFNSGGTNVRVSGWAVDSNGNVEDGALGQWSSGVGVQNSDGDNSHTIDNSGWDDFIVLQFDSAVVLEAVRFTTGWRDSNGYTINDTDATIGYGNLALPLTQSPNWDELAAADAFSGFSFFNSYSAGNGSQTRGVNGSGFAANTWIIGAAPTSPDQYVDGFKVKYVRFDTPPAVPEPSTWLMLLLGFGLIGGMIRSEKRKLSVTYA